MLGSSFLFGKEPEGCRQIAIGAHSSAARADCLPRGKPTVSDGKSQLCRRGAPARGLTRRLRRERWGCRPPGGSYFLSKRKKVPKKARGTATPEAAHPAARNSQISAFRALPCPALVFAQACQSLTAFGSCAHWAHAPSRPKLRSAVAPSGLSSTSVRYAHPPGKRLLLPILPAGLAMSRAMELASLPIRAERARARLFPPSKWAGLFPSAAYRRPAPAQLAGDILNPCRVGCFGVACVFSQGKRPAGNQIHAGLVCEP